MDLMYSFLALAVWFMSTFFVVLMILVIFDKRSDMYASPGNFPVTPKVSVVLPAYNEEDGITSALESLARVEYPRDRYEVVVVNDGSKDRTAELVREFMEGRKDFNLIFIDRRDNKGKAYSLNEGIRASRGEYVACMDGDSIVAPDILSKTVGYFNNQKVASVSVRVNARDPKKLLERIVDVEYAVGLSTALKVLSFLDVMHVTPGPFSIYRRSVLEEIGGFDETNITEDMEIACRLQRLGYKLAFCLSTSVSTAVPTSLRALYKQRKRWYSGSLLTLWQHRDLFFNKGAGMFQAYLLFNYTLVFLGLSLFMYSIYLYISHLMKFINFLRVIDFDLFRYPMEIGFDPLSIDLFTTLAFTMVLMTVVLTAVSSGLLRKSFRDNISGFFGFLFFFVFYQIFWLNSFYTFARRRQIKWR